MWIFPTTVVILDQDKANLKVRYISCIFEDPFDGLTSGAAVLDGVQALLKMGCYEVSLGDTLGVGTAADVRRLLKYLFDHGVPTDRLAGHFHGEFYVPAHTINMVANLESFHRYLWSSCVKCLGRVRARLARFR